MHTCLKRMHPFQIISGLPPPRGIKSKIDTKTNSKSLGNKKLSLLSFRAESDSDSGQLPPMSMTQPNGVHNSVYQPQNFAQSHIDDILRENEDLKMKVSLLLLTFFVDKAKLFIVFYKTQYIYIHTNCMTV